MSDTDEPDDPGDMGGEYPLMNQRRADRLERRAILSKWPEPSRKEKRRIIRRQTHIATDPEESSRESTGAFRALMEVTKINSGNAASGRPSIAIQQNFGDDRPIDRKRAAEADMAEMRREQLAGNVVEMSQVVECINAISNALRSAMDRIHKISPECEQILVDGIEQSERELAKILSK